ncbi:hypothetical protein XENOCAPTIV_010053 [Xenoophorus captivus]|uniref:Secreted protein n=1 Tax=Xenoophorus captivus TaxID=1517983 RepID=A0ABV0SGS2_9TELE
MFVEFFSLRSAPCVLSVLNTLLLSLPLLSSLPQLFSILLIRLTWFQYHFPPLHAVLKLHVFHAGFFCYAPLVSMPCTPRVKCVSSPCFLVIKDSSTTVSFCIKVLFQQHEM